MAYIGFQKPMYCPFTVSTDTSGNETEIYGEIKTFAKGITLTSSLNTSKTKLYADDGVAEQVNEFISGSMTITVDGIENEVSADIAGAKIDSETGDVTNTDTDTPAYVRFGFIVRRFRDNKSMYRAQIYHKVMFDLPADDYETKGESIVFKTETVTAEIMRNKDRDWRKRSEWKESLADAREWLTKNLKPTATA